MIGTKLADKYLIISEIGQGGMSIVYKARHELMDRMVAIKMLQTALISDQTSVKRFQQEAQAASCLTHANVITVYDYGVAPAGEPYIVMDYLQGESLADVIKRDNHVEPRRAVNIFIQACDALEHAHQKGVLHRDLKSSNIMLTECEGHQDVVKVVDFGIAKLMPSSGKQVQNLTQTGEVFGSPIYMSPEQCLGHALDQRSDIYSMGTMLYEALTGKPPLMGDTIVDTMQMHVSTKPDSFAYIRPDLAIAPELERICLRALEKKPADRFPSMAIFKEALERTVDRGDRQDSRPFKPALLRRDSGQPLSTTGIDHSPKAGAFLSTLAERTDGQPRLIDSAQPPPEVATQTVNVISDSSIEEPVVTPAAPLSIEELRASRAAVRTIMTERELATNAKSKSPKNSGIIVIVIMILIGVLLAIAYFLQSSHH